MPPPAVNDASASQPSVTGLLVRTEITPPKASDPYATDPGPRAISTPSTMDGSMKVALGPTRLSEVTRLPSIRIKVRPRARPRTAGTAACPSDTWFTPGTFSTICIRFAGPRCATSARDSIVMAAPSEASILGATPAVTSTSSLTTDSTESVSVWPSVLTSMALPTRPPGRMTTTTNGGRGSGFQVNRPSLSVRTEPGRPTMVTSAPATGAPVFLSSTRPSNAAALPVAANNRQSIMKDTEKRRINVRIVRLGWRYYQFS